MGGGLGKEFTVIRGGDVNGLTGPIWHNQINLISPTLFIFMRPKVDTSVQVAFRIAFPLKPLSVRLASDSPCAD
jgi:hypothetical protein